MSFRRLMSAVRSAREAIANSAPLADRLLKSLLSVVVILCIAVSSPPPASAKPFAISFPAGWSLAGFVGSVGARADEPQRKEPAAGVKPYTGRRISNDTLRMIYYHDQTVAVVELGTNKLLLNCELIETYDEEDTKRLLRQLSSINRPLEVTFQQMVNLMAQCQQVEGVEAQDETGREFNGWREKSSSAAAKARLDAGGAHAGLLGGSPLTLLQGIIPGTKWCGTGDIAADYHDLGADRLLDRCCRTHDLCPTKVRAFSKRYNLINNSLYSKSHCTCDDMLFDCLKATNTSASHLMGHIYFNLVQVPCLEDIPNGRRFRNAKEGF